MKKVNAMESLPFSQQLRKTSDDFGATKILDFHLSSVKIQSISFVSDESGL